jgi:hypothetical protein
MMQDAEPTGLEEEISVSKDTLISAPRYFQWVTIRKTDSRGATVSSCKGFLMGFEDGLEMEQELAHGGDDGAFVGFTSCD